MRVNVITWFLDDLERLKKDKSLPHKTNRGYSKRECIKEITMEEILLPWNKHCAKGRGKHRGLWKGRTTLTNSGGISYRDIGPMGIEMRINEYMLKNENPVIIRNP
jgi:hypothetical protein